MKMLAFYLTYAAMIVAMIATSGGLFWLAYQIYQHQSSAAFQLAIVTGFAGCVHWMLWPKPTKRH